jgi:hypothetical protein
MKRIITSCAILLLIVSQAAAQFTLKGEFRPRFELRDGYGIMLAEDQDPQFTISMRTRLSAYYQIDKFTFGFSIQDVRAWGDDNLASYSGNAGSAASIDLNEGWVAMKIYPNGLIKVGRQFWAYEDERIFSLRNWNQSQVKYDALLFQHISKKIQLDLGLSYNNSADNFLYNSGYSSNRFRTMNFLYIKKNLTDWLYLSGMAIGTGVTKADTSNIMYFQGTYGLYAGVTKGNLKATASGYYQNGRNRKGLNTSAFMFSAKAEYLFAKKLTLGAGIDYLSGKDQESTDPDYVSKNHTFDLFYGNRHGYYGHLDYFSNLPVSTENGGLCDIFLKLGYAIGPNLSAGADLHYFSLQNNVYDPTIEVNETMAKSLGEEVDLYLSWDIVKYVNLKGGYCCYFATDSMEKLQGVYENARFPSWVWVMITARPTFLDTAGK